MKRFFFLVFILVFLTPGCAHRPPLAPSPSSPSSAPPSGARVVMAGSSSEAITLKSPEESGIDGSPDGGTNLKEGLTETGEKAATITDPPQPLRSPPELSAQSGIENAERKENPEGEGEEKEQTTIADPLEPFNRAMFHFNDKLYFWVLKPVAQGYKKVVPEPARVGVKNFFYNLGFPVRFISSLLRADFKGAAAQLGRFVVNTVWGVGGLLDPSSSEQLNLPKQEADLGQTLGIYGMGPGFYIVWPILGPYNVRDSINIAGDYFLAPVSYINPWYDWLAVRAYEEVNDTSLSIGDYESLKEAAIDPYVAVRDAYHQYRRKKVEAGRGRPESPKPGGIQ